MNLTILGLLLKLATVIPRITHDIEGGVKKVEADTGLVQRMDDALKALSLVLDDVIKALG